MSETIAIEISRDVIQATKMTPDELRQELAIHLYQQDKLSFGKAREMAHMSAWAFQLLLGTRGIPIHYDVSDYEHDLAVLEDLGRL